MPAGFRRHLVGKLLEMIFTVISLKYPLLTYRHFNKPTDRMLFKLHDKFSPLNFTHYAKLYLRNRYRIVAIDTLTLLHPV